MRKTFLFLSLALAIGISRPVSCLRANDAVGSEVAAEVATEPATEQAQQAVAGIEIVSTIMIEVFEAVEDAVETGATSVNEFAARDFGIEETYESGVTQEVEAAPETTSEVPSEVAETEILTPGGESDEPAEVTETPVADQPEEMAADDAASAEVAPSDEAVAVVAEISEATVALEAEEVVTEATSVPECSEVVEMVADEALVLEAEAVACDEPIANQPEETAANDATLEQVAPSDEAVAVVDEISEAAVALEAEEVVAAKK